MLSRRSFAKLAVRTGIAAATVPLWRDALCARAFAQVVNGYKAVVLITLEGGNDGNNMVIPLDNAIYAQYASLRTSLAIPQASCNILNSSAGSPVYGMHPALVNVASSYNSGSAAIVANVGPLATVATKATLLATPSLVPQALLSHPAGINQWESATVEALPATGWGGRIADLVASQSGSLPPLFDTGGQSIFTVGQSVQGVSVIANSAGSASAIPAGVQNAMMAIASNDALSQNQILAQAGLLRVQSNAQQALIAQAQSSGTALKTVFPASSFGQSMRAIASIINGRSVIGATRQIFYAQQGLYDSHANQLGFQAANFADLDAGLGAFMAALQEIGLANQVLVCTHSDFNRTTLANTAGGSDHAWGNHQLILGGGIRGGRMIGTYPDLDLNGSMDFNGYGTWIPGLSVTQMTAGIGTWMGLTTTQIAAVFPALSNFPSGGISLT
jgi:uncharacterized protein (DUF1501 family)